MEEAVKKKKKTTRTRKLKYEKSETPVDPKGLTFPDSFMAIMGWRRVK